MTTLTPDWRKLAAIPWSAQVAQICAALGHTEIPPEGRSRMFQSPLLSLSCEYHERYFVLHRGQDSRVLLTPDKVAEATRCRGSGPTNEALRTWLRWWGWQSIPPSP